MALFAAVITTTSPMLIEIANAYNLDMSGSGFVISASYIGFFAFIFIGGLACSVFSKKTVLSLAMAGFSFTLLCIRFVHSYVLLCILMMFIGGFGGILESLVSSLVFEVNPNNTSFYVNMTQVFFGVGALLGPIAAGFALTIGVKWVNCYSFAGIASVLLTLMFVFVRAPDIKRYNTISPGKLNQILRNRKFMFICVCMIFYSGAEIGCWGWMSTFVKERLNFSVLESGIAVGVFWMSMTLGRIVCGQFTLRYKPRNIIIMLALMSSVVTMVSAISNARTIAWIVIALLGFTYSSQWPLIVSYGGDFSGTSSGIVFSILVGSGGVGTIVIPYFMGVIGQHASVNMAMASPSLFLLAVGLIFLFLIKPSTEPIKV